MSIPQNAIPITIDGHQYLVEIDEFGAQSEVGAGRIIDIGDETQPQGVSNLRLEVHQPENFAAKANDPGAQNPVQGYAGHYCNVPTRVDPEIVACSMILSGLRVFDIRDPEHPREIAYFNAPITPRIVPPAASPGADNWAMSSPSFVPERDEIWYSDGYSGFYAVRLTNGAAWVLGGGGGRGRPQVPRPALPDRPSQHRPRPARLHARAAARAAGAAGPDHRPLVPLLREAELRPRDRRLLTPRPRRPGGDHGPCPRQPAPSPGLVGEALRRAYSRRRSLGHGIYRANPHSPRLIGVRKGRCGSSLWRAASFCETRRVVQRRQRYSDASVRYGAQRSPTARASRRRAALEPVQPLDRAADALVADRQHVRPAEVEHQEHVRGPLAEALDRGQLRDHPLVAHLVERSRWRSPASTFSASSRTYSPCPREADRAHVSGSASSSSAAWACGRRTARSSGRRSCAPP